MFSHYHHALFVLLLPHEYVKIYISLSEFLYYQNSHRKLRHGQMSGRKFFAMEFR